MSPDKINALTQLLMALAAVVGPLSAAYIARLRAKERKECRARGEDTDRDPPIAGIGPVLLLLFGGAMLAYLFAQHPELARLPLVRGDEMAAAAPDTSMAVCTKHSDCGSGCACDNGRCKCSAKRPKPTPPQRQHPRLVATIGHGTLCADCLALPQLYVPVSQPF